MSASSITLVTSNIAHTPRPYHINSKSRANNSLHQMPRRLLHVVCSLFIYIGDWQPAKIRMSPISSNIHEITSRESIFISKRFHKKWDEIRRKLLSRELSYLPGCCFYYAVTWASIMEECEIGRFVWHLSLIYSQPEPWIAMWRERG